MKVQQTIAACIGWRRKYQKPFELIGVGVKQFHSGERKAALATKLGSWKSAILFNARPVAREALRVKITDLCVYVCVCARIDSAKAVHLCVFFLNNDVSATISGIDTRSLSFYRERNLEWLFFSFHGKSWTSNNSLFLFLLNNIGWWIFLSVQFWEVKVTSKNCIYRVVEMGYWKYRILRGRIFKLSLKNFWIFFQVRDTNIARYEMRIVVFYWQAAVSFRALKFFSANMRII